MTIERTKTFYDNAFRTSGFAAPNEELLRFFGIYYFTLTSEARRQVRVLEAGCGSGANLWMIAREGFEAHGIDLSAEGLALCNQMLSKWGTVANLKQGNMAALDDDGFFDVVIDVFSSY